LKRWTREEYNRLIDAGLLRPEDPLELVEGEIVQMAAQSAAHSATVAMVDAVLHRVLGLGVSLRAQLPLALGGHSEPEPDVAVVLGQPGDYRKEKPTPALLVIEVADSSLEYDRAVKGRLYARHGILEYWIVNLVDRFLEIYRAPDPELGYRTRAI